MEAITSPFVGTEALRAGVVSRRALYRDHVAVYRNVYVPRSTEITALVRAQAAWLWSGRKAALGGLSASAVHGALWIDGSLPAEVYRIADDSDGIVIRRGKLRDDEVCVVHGMTVTTPDRTAYDIARQKGLADAVIRVDALARATELKRSDIQVVADRNRGARGIVQLRQVLDLFDAGAESPMESRARLTFVMAGMPTPETQILVRDEFGRTIARIDMGWPEWRVGVEYDGAQHWTHAEQRAWDIDRLAMLEALGWRIIRISASILRTRPAVMIERTVDAMRAAGWAGEVRPIARF